TVSVEFYMGLTYLSDGSNSVWGQARVTVKIEMLFFSISVDLSIERRFAGSSGSSGPANASASLFGGSAGLMLQQAATPPTILQLMPRAAWAEYCDAFAAY